MKESFLLLIALSLVLCAFASTAFADGKVWENCTVGLTQVAPGDVIKSNVILTDDTGKNLGSFDFCVHYGSEGKLDLGFDSTSGWLGWGTVKVLPLIEKINSYGFNFTELPVINNICYVAPDPDIPDTGDNATVGLWVTMMIASAMCAVVLIKQKNRI